MVHILILRNSNFKKKGGDTMKGLYGTLLGIAWLLILAGSAFATPVYYPDTGHYYEAIPGPIMWPDARAEAESRIYNGMRGHLATITSSGENAFLWNNLGMDVFFYYLGGTDEANEGVWQWITGEPWGYTNWYYGEPNNLNNEDVLVFWYSGRWNDYSTAYAANGYIVEYENMAGVPEPATLWLLLTGIMIIIWSGSTTLPLHVKVKKIY